MTSQEIRRMANLVKGFRAKQDFQNTWITESINQEGIDYSQKLGFLLCDYQERNGRLEDRPGRNALTNSQIRNVFGEVKRIQMKVSGNDNEWKNIKSSFLLLQPKLAYATGRITGKNKYAKLATLSEIITLASIGVKADETGAVGRFMNFVDFLESILAYHKAFGGKE